ERLFKRPASEIQGEPLQRFLHWNIAQKPGALEPLILETVTRSDALAGDGTMIPVEFSLACSGAGDELLFTAVVRDMSERVLAEDRIRAFAEGLEATNRRLAEVNAQLEEASR